MGAAVAAIVVKREREVVEAFVHAGAIVPEKALTLDEVGANRFAHRLVEAGVLREAPLGSGRYYIDFELWMDRQRRRRMIGVGLLVIVLLVGLISLMRTSPLQ